MKVDWHATRNDVLKAVHARFFANSNTAPASPRTRSERAAALEQWWIDNGWRVIGWPLLVTMLGGCVIFSAKIIVYAWDALSSLF